MGPCPGLRARIGSHRSSQRIRSCFLSLEKFQKIPHKVGKPIPYFHWGSQNHPHHLPPT